MMKSVHIRSNQGLALEVEIADNMWTRFWGLLGRKGLDDGHGMWIRPCSSVHTWFMGFTIDIAYLTRDGEVVKVVKRLSPYRFSVGGRGAHSVLELPAGFLEKNALAVGDKIEIVNMARTTAEAAVGTPAESQ